MHYTVALHTKTMAHGRHCKLYLSVHGLPGFDPEYDDDQGEDFEIDWFIRSDIDPESLRAEIIKELYDLYQCHDKLKDGDVFLVDSCGPMGSFKAICRWVHVRALPHALEPEEFEICRLCHKGAHVQYMDLFPGISGQGAEWYCQHCQEHNHAELERVQRNIDEYMQGRG